MEILLWILIYILGCIVATCLGAIMDVYFEDGPDYPIALSFGSWMTVILTIIIFIINKIPYFGLESLYKWVYNKFEKL